MTHPDMFNFGQFMPGLNLFQPPAGAAGAQPVIPGLAAWALPTADVQELDKRITDLRAVLFWLEQNATVIKATVQALEVQKLTLHTLAGMNMNMADVAKAFTASALTPAPQPAASAAPAAVSASSQWPFAATPASAPAQPAAQSAPSAEPAEPAEPAPQARPQPGPPPVAAMPDPLQWWDALNRQFQHMAQQVAAASAPAGAAASGDAGRQAPARVKKPAKAKGNTASKPAAKKPSRPAVKSAAKATAKKVVKPAPAGDAWPLPKTRQNAR